jgi:hypothetical protein
MKARFWLPGPTAWLSAVLLYVFLSVWGMVAARVIPDLLEMLRTSPRLAVLGALGLWLGPIVLLSLFHQATHAMMDGLDPRGASSPRPSADKGVVPSIASWWAGAFAWLVMFFASTTTTLILLFVFPPKPPEPDLMAYVSEAVAMQPGQGTIAFLYLGTWLTLAAWLFNLEKMAKDKSSAA